MKLLFTCWSRHNPILLQHFFDHYRSLGVSDFYCIYHSYKERDREIHDLIKKQATIAHYWDQPWNTQEEVFLANKLKQEIASSFDEWIWVVDVDEFVDITPELANQIVTSNTNYSGGLLIDMFSPDGLVAPKIGETPFETYPIRTFFTRDFLLGYHGKVPLTRAYVPLIAGHHYINEEFKDHPLIPFTTQIDTCHFKWHHDTSEEIYYKLTETTNAGPFWGKEMCRFMLGLYYKKISILEIIESTRCPDDYIPANQKRDSLTSTELSL